jgi:hypothetical protein
MRLFLIQPLKDTLYKKRHTIQELQQEISAAVISDRKEIAAAVERNCHCPLQTVLDTDVAHIKDVFK